MELDNTFWICRISVTCKGQHRHHMLLGVTPGKAHHHGIKDSIWGICTISKLDARIQQKKRGAASKKGKQYPGSEESPEHREEAGEWTTYCEQNFSVLRLEWWSFLVQSPLIFLNSCPSVSNGLDYWWSILHGDVWSWLEFFLTSLFSALWVLPSLCSTKSSTWFGFRI